MIIDKPKHDGLFKKAMENPIVAKEFFETHLPEDIRALINTNSLKLEKDSFIEQNLQNSFSDVLFSVQFDNKDSYIYILLEHQSSPDPLMTFRILKYMTSICSRHMTLNPEAKHLPLVYPLIFYNGKKPYNVSRNLWDLFENSNLAKDIWTNDYQLINVHDIPDSELKKQAWSGIMQFFLKHIHERELFNRWQEIADLLPQFAKVNIGYEYIETVLFYTLTKIREDDKIKLEQLLISELNQEIGEKLMVSLARHWEEEGIEKGKVIGIQEGIEKGIEKTAINMLKQNLDIKLISQITGYSIEEITKLKD